MTREEEIKNEAKLKCYDIASEVDYMSSAAYDGFVMGAEWADEWWINRLQSTDITLSGRLHNIWKCMHQRCTNPNRKEFKYYGAKGISVCEEWKNFTSFAIWSLLNGYSDLLTIDRIDNNEGYKPSNCRWADYITQANNTSRNHIVGGSTIANLASETNMNYRTMHNRITRGGMGVEDAKNAQPYNPKKVYQYSINGDFIAEYPSAKIASKQLGGKGRNHIDDVCRGQRKTAFGYKWLYNKI